MTAPASRTAGDDLAIAVGRALAGLDPARLAAEYGTPFYLYDLDVITRRVAALRAALPAARFDLAYAIKANPSLAVVAHLASLGLGADIASGGELALVRRAGFAPARVLFTGPGKSDAELRAAVESGVGSITVESPGELARLERIAAAAGRRMPILLRLAVGERSVLEAVRIIGDGGLGKFGMAASDLAIAAERAARSPHLQLLGVHAFGASNVRVASALVEHIGETVAYAERVAADVGVPLALVDGGGGLGIPYADGEPPLDLDALGSGLERLEREWSADPGLAGLRVLLEPGRFLVGPAGAYVTRVLDVKTLDGRTVAVVDGGIHHVLRPALVRQGHRVVRLGAESGTGGAEAAVVGPLCTGLDILSPAAPIGAVAVGDLLAVLDVGAYGFTESMPLFLSRPLPAEVVVSWGRTALVRPAIDPAEFLDRQRLPDW